jgi:predicted nucleotidyltransferase
MRVPKPIAQSFSEAAKKSFGECRLYLFGSRTDPAKRGGDFDLAIDCTLDKEAFKAAKIRFFKELLLHDLDLPIDLVSYRDAPAKLRAEIDRQKILIS